jgi:hypothetical protein
MRTKLLTGLLAIVMAAAIGATGGARPAKAAVPWLQLGIAVASHLFGGGGGSDAIERAKQEIIAAINASRQEMLNHIDAIAAADVRACNQAATTLVAQIDLMDPFVLASFVLDAVNCSALSSAYFDAVQSPASADNIGKLMGSIYSIAMLGFAKLGFPTVDLLDDLIVSYESVVRKLVPSCREDTVREYDFNGRIVSLEIQYMCTAYNGDQGYGSEVYYRGKRVTPPLNRPAVEDQATINTSRGVAQAALPTLRSLRATMP